MSIALDSSYKCPRHAILRATRIAHVISLDRNGPRFLSTARFLNTIGFEVHHFQPIPLDDPQALAWERRFTRTHDPKKGSPRSAISLSLSHLALWKAFPSPGEWLYVFEDDVMLAPYGSRGARGTYTWEWPAGFDTTRVVRCLLDEAEKLVDSDLGAFSSAPMIYFGGSGCHHRMTR